MFPTLTPPGGQVTHRRCSSMILNMPYIYITYYRPLFIMQHMRRPLGIGPIRRLERRHSRSISSPAQQIVTLKCFLGDMHGFVNAFPKRYVGRVVKCPSELPDCQKNRKPAVSKGLGNDVVEVHGKPLEDVRLLIRYAYKNILSHFTSTSPRWDSWDICHPISTFQGFILCPPLTSLHKTWLKVKIAITDLN